jgi:hypothetical protein
MFYLYDNLEGLHPKEKRKKIERFRESLNFTHYILNYREKKPIFATACNKDHIPQAKNNDDDDIQ